MSAAGCRTTATMAARTITLARREAVLQATSTIGAKTACMIDMNAVPIISDRAPSPDADPMTTDQTAADLVATAHPVVTNATGTAAAMRAAGKRDPQGIPPAEMPVAAVREQGLTIDT